MAQDHTPTPWRSEELPTSCGRVFRIGDDRMLSGMKTLGERKIGPAIVYDDYPGAPLTEQSANAAFIVRAVNSHDQMLAALLSLANTADGLSFREEAIRNIIGNTNWSVLQVHIEAARAAIAAASPTTEESERT